jgi:hypothetical protein
MAWNHYLQAARLDLEEVEPLYVHTDGLAADLLNNAHPMVRVNNLVTNVENGVTRDHAGHPEARKDCKALCFLV